MTVWETLWSLDLVEAFQVLPPPVCSALAVGFGFYLITVIYNGVYGRKKAGKVILKIRPTVGMRVRCGLYCMISVIACLFLFFCVYYMFNAFFVKPYADAGGIGNPLTRAFCEYHGRLLLPAMICYIVLGLLAFLSGIEFVLDALYSFRICDDGVLVNQDWLSPFFPWNRISRAVWIKRSTVRLEFDNGSRKFHVHPRHIEKSTVELGRFIEVVDYETYKKSGKSVYPRSRRRFQFSLRTMMLATMVLAVFSAAFAARIHEAMRVRRICEKLTQSGADVERWGLAINYVGWYEDAHPPTNEDMAILEELDCVTGICVFGPRITDDGLRHLRSLETLQCLYLDETNVKGAGLKHLASLKRLELLTLNKSAVTDDAFVNLSGLTQLKYLQLDGTKISGTELGRLASLRTLETLSLEKAFITDAGLQQIGKIKSLKILELNGTQVTDVGLAHLAELIELENLDLANTKISGMGLGCLAEMPFLANLSLENAPITDIGLQQIGKFKRIDALNLSGTKVTDSGLIHLSGLTCLRDLNLDGTNISGKGLRHLTMLKTLNYLSLQGTKVTDKELVHLQHLPELITVKLYGTAVTKAVAEEMLPKVHIVEVSEPNDLSENELKDGIPDKTLPSGNVPVK